MKLIPLTKGKFAKVDDDDYDHILSGYTWWYNKRKNREYAYGWKRRKRGEPECKVTVHRVIMGYVEGVHYDHIDGDGLNNQRSNLRPVTHHQNMANMRPRKNKKYKGIERRKRNPRRWRACICCKGKRRSVGNFKSAKEAALAYNFLAVYYFGEYAWLNEVYL